MRHEASEIVKDGGAYHGVMTDVRRVHDKSLNPTTRHISKAVP